MRGGREADGGIRAADDTGQRYCAGGVGDDQIRRVEGVGFSVERGQHFALGGAATEDGPACSLSASKACIGWESPASRKLVTSDDVRDRIQAMASSGLQPQRRWPTRTLSKTNAE